MSSKPTTPAAESRESKSASPTNKAAAAGKAGKTGSAAAGGKPPAGGSKSGASSATPRGGSSRKGLISPDPSASAAGGATPVPGAQAAPAEQKEPSDHEYLQQLYAEQKEQERLKMLQGSHDTLLTTLAELHKQIANSDSKHIDALLHRKREKQEQAAHTKALNERIEELQAQVAELQASAVATAASTAAAHANTVMLLEDRMAVIQAKYESLYQFKEEKADLELQLSKFQELLAREKENHALNVSELERRNVMEKDQLKNEMLRKIRETKLSLLAMTEDQLHTTTKRTIMENEQMTTELQYQSKETERIVRRNEKLLKENAALKRELDLATSTQQQMAKKTMFFSQLITKLQGKLDQMAGEMDKERKQAHAQIQQMQNQMIFVQQQQLGGGAHSAGLGGRAGGAASSLSGILRGVEEMNALAAAASSTLPSNGLPLILPSQQTRSNNHSRAGQRGSGLGSGGADSTTSHSRTSHHHHSGVATSAIGSSSGTEDAATIHRLHDKLSTLERERSQLAEQLRQQREKERVDEKERAREREEKKAVEEELAELQATVQRERGRQHASSALSAQAVSFIASCLEEQRIQLERQREHSARNHREVEAATLGAVVTDGTEETVVVKGEGERPLQGAQVLAEQSRGASRASSAASVSTTAGGKHPPSPYDVSTRGYPSSLTSLPAAERAAVLEHLLSQIAVFSKTNPKDMGMTSATKQQAHQQQSQSSRHSSATSQSGRPKSSTRDQQQQQEEDDQAEEEEEVEED